MTDQEIRALLASVHDGSTPIDEALDRLRRGPFRVASLPHAEVDHHRQLRQGLGEVIYCEFKTEEQVLAIATEAAIHAHPVLLTRLSPAASVSLVRRFPSGRANPVARTFVIHPPETAAPDASASPHVAIIGAGTSDLPVVEEACEVCVAMQTPFVRVIDVGVAGLHRLLGKMDVLQAATAIVVVAGMEGALPSVVAGLLRRPVFAVPTSVGYGASFGGLAALLGMLNSCAAGVTVANIDNGFSAAFAACQVVRAVREGAARSP